MKLFTNLEMQWSLVMRQRQYNRLSLVLQITGLHTQTTNVMIISVKCQYVKNINEYKVYMINHVIIRNPMIIAQSLPSNTDQILGIDPKYLSMPIIADQFLSIPLNADQCQIKASVIGTNNTFWSVLIDIDQHWAMIKRVLHWLLKYTQWRDKTKELHIELFKKEKTALMHSNYVLK